MTDQLHSSVSKDQNDGTKLDAADLEGLRLSPSEEALALQDSNSIKTEANAQFSQGSFQDAISTYERALGATPSYLEYETAVLKANLAACHVKLEQWKDAIDRATAAVDALATFEPLLRPPPPAPKEPVSDASSTSPPAAGKAEEIDDVGELRLADLQRLGHTVADVRRVACKAVLRRARARCRQGGWADLEAARQDYELLLGKQDLKEQMNQIDAKTAADELRLIGPRLEQAKKNEMDEMLSKLKNLGNGLLKPFGLSTDMFQFKQDDKGGYSMNINSN